MKKIIILLFSITLLNGYSQKMYVNLSVGYGFATDTQKYGENSIELINSTKIESVDYSLGKGIYVNGAIGYMFNKYFGTELGISYLKGVKTESTDTFLDPIFNANFSSSGTMLRFIPQIVLTPGFEKINPYAKFGLIIGTNPSFSEVQSYYLVTKVERTDNYDGGVAFGFSSSIGVLYKLNNKFSLSSEVSLTSLSYSPKRQKITNYTVDGMDILNLLPVKDKEIEYFDEYFSPNGVIVNDNEPKKQLSIKVPFSSIGLNFGVHYQF